MLQAVRCQRLNLFTMPFVAHWESCDTSDSGYFGWRDRASDAVRDDTNNVLCV